VREIRQAYQLNELRACGLMRITRWSNRYESRRDLQTELRVRLQFNNPLFVSLGFSLLGAFYASLVLLAVVNPGRIGKVIFGWRPLVSLGVVAYSVYLFHEGINFLIHGKVLGSIPTFDDWRSIFLTLVSLVTVLLLAAVTWRAMERPLIERAHAKYRYSKVGAGSRI
jgi:peptidoglycan/LPS O-acetylase OafA/YrhL